MRSRFRVMACLAGAISLLAACSNHFGPGITELPAAQGWQPLPIGSWVLNDGIETRAMAFCPREACIHQGFAALVALEGPRAQDMERALAADPASLARIFAKPATGRPPHAKSRGQAVARSDTSVTRFEEAGAHGLLVAIRARDGGKTAFTAIVTGRAAGKLLVAIGVSPQAQDARTQALAAWRDR